MLKSNQSRIITTDSSIQQKVRGAVDETSISSFLHLFMLSFNEHFLNLYSVPAIELTTGDTIMDKRENPYLWILPSN